MSQKSKSQKNPKASATSVIWGCAVGMLAICIPIVEAADGGILLPFAVVAGAATATAFVWRSPNEMQQADTRYLRALEARIETLEAICSSAEIDLERRFRELQGSQTQALQDQQHRPNP